MVRQKAASALYLQVEQLRLGRAVLMPHGREDSVHECVQEVGTLPQVVHPLVHDQVEQDQLGPVEDEGGEPMRGPVLVLRFVVDLAMVQLRGMRCGERGEHVLRVLLPDAQRQHLLRDLRHGRQNGPGIEVRVHGLAGLHVFVFEAGSDTVGCPLQLLAEQLVPDVVDEDPTLDVCDVWGSDWVARGDDCSLSAHLKAAPHAFLGIAAALIESCQRLVVFLILDNDPHGWVCHVFRQSAANHIHILQPKIIRICISGRRLPRSSEVRHHGPQRDVYD
mmetsp:Transcript_11113/g.19932  ORF Transcript_11113/g.19932 Transcript_11113/m.19932 type:complete len:277 (+) Transcript_11113:1127-1957(+)